MNAPVGRQATKAEVEHLAAITDPMADYLMSLPNSQCVHALCLLASTIVLNAEAGMPKVDAWDHIAASIRRTIAENVKRGLS